MSYARKVDMENKNLQPWANQILTFVTCDMNRKTMYK